MAIHPNTGNDQHEDGTANDTEPAVSTASTTAGTLGSDQLSPLGHANPTLRQSPHTPMVASDANGEANLGRERHETRPGTPIREPGEPESQAEGGTLSNFQLSPAASPP
jgi:hypothetical protein